MIGGRSRLRGPVQRAVVIVCLGGTFAGTGAAFLAVHPSQGRVLYATLIALNLLVVAVRAPRAAVFMAFGFLVFLGVIRRLLISVEGWSPYDVLVVVVPAMSLVLTWHLFLVQRRTIAPDLLSRLVVTLLAVSVLEVFNPQGGGVLVGLTGLLFVAAPLVWFLIGRELGDDRMACRLLTGVVVMGVGVALYGIWQTSVGLPSWDLEWVNVNGYHSLSLGDGVIRAFGTMSNSSEYAGVLGAALAITVAGLLRGHLAALLPLAVLPVALVLSSVRSGFVTTVVVIIVLLGLRTGRGRLLLLTVVLGISAAVAGQKAVGQSLASSAARSGNALVIHEVGGLTDPLNPEKSTLIVHLNLVTEGFQQAFRSPLGRGTAATTLASSKVGGAGATSSEVDISDEFLGLGVAGGGVYLVIVVIVLWRLLHGGLTRPNFVNLAIVGVVIASLGQWLNGANYALSPMVWLLIGIANAPPTMARALEPIA